MKLVFIKEFVTVKHDKANRLLHISWEGYITGEEYVMLIRELLRLTTKLNICGWLSDMRSAEGIRPEDIRWGVSCITSALQHLPLRKVAHVSRPDDAFRSQATAPAAAAAQQPAFDFRVFTDYKEALDWLPGTGAGSGHIV